MNSTVCKDKLDKYFEGHDLKRSDALEISNCISALEQENDSLKRKVSNFQGAIQSIFDISKGYSSTCREFEQSIAQLEAVSGYSLSQIIDMFKQGYTLEYPEDTFREQMQLIALKHEIEKMRKAKEKLYR
ncbi:hypothetical protein [Intestinibacillus sp. Marseille-P6563]|uniref:hypothetical protein n=1 Tax=Intestinibacillus sp. Marseille-P6563 TaxID=2364792 RepID=UPI000F0595FB|nr:hypothetical protein [Intestinibacillus sp. Marseille-P6563]